MHIINYFQEKRQSHWLTQIKTCDWRAGQFLAELLETNKFHQIVGENSTLLLLTDGDALVSFATYAERDCIDDPTLTPWVGFVYTYPEYRGQRRMGQLLEDIAVAAHRDGHNALYVCTDHVGLYEKYGFTFLENRVSIYGETSRVLKRELPPIPKGSDEKC